MRTRDLKRIFWCLFVYTCSLYGYSQSSQKQVYVLVHGAWGGGWAFKEVDSLLTSKGNIVYRPTLTGLGERAHLATPKIGLETHIEDIVNVVLYESLRDIILVGHSYGGMVVTGVADRIPNRIKKMVYIDALVPNHQESGLSILGSLGPDKEGFIIPTWVSENQPIPKDVPHPTKTWTDAIILKNDKRLEVATTYILTVEENKNPQEDVFASQADRARKKGWTVLQLQADHNAQWSAPKEFVEMLIQIEQK